MMENDRPFATNNFLRTLKPPEPLPNKVRIINSTQTHVEKRMNIVLIDIVYAHSLIELLLVQVCARFLKLTIGLFASIQFRRLTRSDDFTWIVNGCFGYFDC